MRCFKRSHSPLASSCASSAFFWASISSRTLTGSMPSKALSALCAFFNSSLAFCSASFFCMFSFSSLASASDSLGLPSSAPLPSLPPSAPFSPSAPPSPAPDPPSPSPAAPALPPPFWLPLPSSGFWTCQDFILCIHNYIFCLSDQSLGQWVNAGRFSWPTGCKSSIDRRRRCRLLVVLTLLVFPCRLGSALRPAALRAGALLHRSLADNLTVGAGRRLAHGCGQVNRIDRPVLQLFQHLALQILGQLREQLVDQRFHLLTTHRIGRIDQQQPTNKNELVVQAAGVEVVWILDQLFQTIELLFFAIPQCHQPHQLVFKHFQAVCFCLQKSVDALEIVCLCHAG